MSAVFLANKKKQISDRLEVMNGLLPSEFARQPRPLSELERWKATEHRQFLLYTGPVVLRGVVSTELYKHFLTLSLAMSIMLESNDEKRNHYLTYAQELLQDFVSKSPDIYGNTFNVYVVKLHVSANDTISLSDLIFCSVLFSGWLLKSEWRWAVTRPQWQLSPTLTWWHWPFN